MKQVKDIKESVIRRTFNDEKFIMAMLCPLLIAYMEE